MASLLYEYRNRHNFSALWGINGGVCFFAKKDKPSLVFITSDNTHNASSCEHCNSFNTKIVLEGFVQGGNIVVHEHIGPDEDIVRCVKEHYDLEPVILRSSVDRGQKQMEVWLWNFYMQIDPFGNDHSYTGSQWKDLIDNQKTKKPIERAFEQMTWCATRFQYQFRNFHKNFYVPMLLGRKYLILK